MDKIEPQVIAIASMDRDGGVVLLKLNGFQLRQRRPGDLVTAEILAIVPTDHPGG